MADLYHECGIAAIYHLPDETCSPLCEDIGAEAVSRLMPRMLLDIQNRGQLSAGMTTFNPEGKQLIDTHKDIGGVSEVFRLSHPGKRENLMKRYDGRAAIGHVRYATCGGDDRSYAQPFERHHIQKTKWFSFGFNGQLANYAQLREELLAGGDHHLTRESDTEIIMHEISKEISKTPGIALLDVMKNISVRFDGAYCLALLTAKGDMLIARDPLGIKPLCYAIQGALVAAASESVALVNLGFDPKNIHSLKPGHALTVQDGKCSIDAFAEEKGSAHCFFEWIYFANVASTLDDRSVYLSRTTLGEELARIEIEKGNVPLDSGTIVVPVPDTSKAAADSMAFQLGVPSREGLIRNRYAGRTFIEGSKSRFRAVQTKYTPLREVMEGKRVFLVEDSIVRSTTMRGLLDRIREQGGAKEIHVRVACPPIIAPCFYGIDMSTIDELFAPGFLHGGELTEAIQDQMAEELGADSLRYLPLESIARAVDLPADHLCQACITGKYPTKCGQELYQLALEKVGDTSAQRTYEQAPTVRG